MVIREIFCTVVYIFMFTVYMHALNIQHFSILLQFYYHFKQNETDIKQSDIEYKAECWVTFLP